MRHILLILALICGPVAAVAETTNPVIRDVVEGHILPKFDTLSGAAQQLSDVAGADCSPNSDALRRAYAAAFDAWVSASHLRFGPTEVENRAFALAFWPDSRGKTPRALTALIANQDPVADTPEGYGEVSIAARGFYALEYLLYDEAFAMTGDAPYRCALIRTISADIASLSASINEEWQDSYGAMMLSPGAQGVYRSDEEVLQEMFKALAAGLQFTSDARLGQPLGTFERPRPTRAEARRSGRSARHVELSLLALHDLTKRLAGSDTALVAKFDGQFDHVLSRLAELNDPVFAGVKDPQGRIRVEVIQQRVDDIRATVQEELGPLLGVAAGFNALDGD